MLFKIGTSLYHDTVDTFESIFLAVLKIDASPYLGTVGNSVQIWLKLDVDCTPRRDSKSIEVNKRGVLQEYFIKETVS